MALDVAQTSLYQKYIELYRNGDEKAIDALKPFATHADLSSTIKGLLSYPTGFGYLQDAFTVSGDEYNTIYEILHSELEYYTKSRIDPLSITNAKLILEDSGIQLYPKRKMDVELHYYAKPNTPSMVYSTDSNNEIIGVTGSGLLITVTGVSAGGVITTVSITNGGTGYVDGTYNNVPLINVTGSGSGAVFNFFVANGSIVAYTIFSGGSGYSSNPVISTMTITSSTELDFDKQFYIEIMNLALMYIGINLSQQELLQIIGGIAK